jgi:DNA uptake protein ComE-like DNA-binding protein
MRLSHIGALSALALMLAAPALAQTAAPAAKPQSPAATTPTKAAPAPAAAKAAAPATAPASTPQAGTIDINSAAKDELDALPLIGPARAEAIIKGRPYRAKTDLLTKKIIPQNAYEAIKDRIVAHQKT